MKKCCQLLSLLSLILAGTYCVSFSQTTTFNYTGAVQTWTVPAGVNAIFVDAQGAQGGTAGAYPGVGLSIGPTVAGCGGRVQANLAVTPGQVLNITVGGSGSVGVGVSTTFGGYNGGGSTQTWAPATLGYSGGSGGGKTDISLSGTELIVAGGGGGAGYNGSCALSGQPGADGGGLSGANATSCTITGATITPSGGGTQTGGGAGGFFCCGGYYAGTPGTSGTGGNNVDSGGIGGGGGGGYYGGGGGCWMGGGGGSSYTNPSFTTSVTHTRGYNCSAGIVIICLLPNTGAISGAASICGSGTTATLSSSGTSGGTWSSSASAIASVDPTGIVSGISGGTATISYTLSNSCGTIATTTTINVITAGTIIGKDSVCQGVADHLSDTTASGGVWSSFNTALATVGSGTGIVTGATVGMDTIYYTVTVGGCTTKTKVAMKVKSHAACIAGVTAVANNGPAITVVPNPSPGVFTVSLSSDIDEDACFRITNMVGEKIAEVTGNTNSTVTVRLNVPGGIYFLNASTRHGTWTEKILITK